MTHPDIDDRGPRDIAGRIHATAPFYTPEWNPAAPDDAGTALTGIFGDMVFEVLNRLNQVPERHLAAFLSLLGLRQIPPQPAETVVAFTLAKDAKTIVTIPAATQVVAGKTSEHGELVFETMETIVATPAKLLALYSAIPDPGRGREKIHCHTGDLNGGQSFELFHGDENIQNHALFIGHGELLSFSHGGVITLVGLPAGLATDLEWSYSTPDNSKGIFSAAATAEGIVLTTGANKPATVGSTVNNLSSIWIKASPKLQANGQSTLFLVRDTVVKNGLRLGAASPPGVAIPPELAIAGDVPLDLTLEADGDFKTTLLPFGDKPAALATFHLGSGEVFSKKGATVTLTVSSSYAGDIPVEIIQGIGHTFAARLRERGIGSAAGILVRSDEEIAEIIRQDGKPAAASLTRARNIREATAKEYYDKTGLAGPLQESTAGFPQPGLSWEYWNGQGWAVLENVVDSTARFLFSGAITFTCPPDIAKTKVAGQESYWIRVRLVTGDYGKEFQVVGNEVVAQGFTPPRLTSLSLSYAHDADALVPPVHLLALNNLEWEDGAALILAGKPFKPFRPLPDEQPALYLGFDRVLTGGPVSIFLNLVEQDYPRDFRPVIRWEGYDPDTGEWQRLTVEDGTADMTRAGLVRLLFPGDGAVSSRFGLTLFWIRAKLAQGAFVPALEAAEAALASGKIDIRFFTGYLAWKDQIKRASLAALPRLSLATGALAPRASAVAAIAREGCLTKETTMLGVGFIPNALKKNPPLAKSIVMNAVAARELHTVREERLGSGSGLPGQAFFFAKKPVFEEEVWVNEIETLPKAELDAMKAASPDRVREVFDSKGTPKEVWVRWEGQEDLLHSGPLDRHYSLDRSTGELLFGNGKRGRVLPAGKNNIKAAYRNGGGAAGNVDAAEIARMKTAIALVDKVKNPEPAGGGVEGETLAAVFQRGPNTLRHRYRAVTAQDYENLILESFPGLARVRCLPTFSDEGKTKTGWVTAILVPESDDTQPMPSVELRRKVEDFLAAHAANVVTAPRHAVVTGPTYVQVSVTTRLAPVSVDLAPAVERTALAALTSFLHPLRGGFDKTGWPFGRLVCFSDLYTLLDGLEGVDRVTGLSVIVTDAFGNVSELATGERAPTILPPYVLVSSGEHHVEAR